MPFAGNQKRFPLNDSGAALSMSVWLNTPLITNSAGKLISFRIYYIRIAIIAKLLFFPRPSFNFRRNFANKLINRFILLYSKGFKILFHLDTPGCNFQATENQHLV